MKIRVYVNYVFPADWNTETDEVKLTNGLFNKIFGSWAFDFVHWLWSFRWAYNNKEQMFVNRIAKKHKKYAKRIQNKRNKSG